MTAAMLVLDPIFEADLPPEQYAYRVGRNAQQAVIDAEEALYHGHPEVVDADLADYFGSIPHADLMSSLARRIVDSRVLHLIKMWLECAVEETDDRGRKKRTAEAKDSGRGIPQGPPITPRTQKVISADWTSGDRMGRRQAARRGWWRAGRDAVPDEDGVITDQNLLDDEAHDALTLEGVECISSAAQPRQERGERLCQSHEHGAITGLIGDRLQFGAQRFLTIAQRRHALAQLLEREEIFLVGAQQSLDTLVDTSQFSLRTLLALFGGIRCTCGHETTIEFVLDQSGIFEQPDDLRPDDLIEQFLAHQASVVAHGSAEFAPTIRADALVVVELPCAGDRRGAREGMTALLAADQTLHSSV